MAKRKNPAAVALGRLGGSAPRKGAIGYAALTKAERSEKAREGARAMWAKKRAAKKKGQ